MKQDKQVRWDDASGKTVQRLDVEALALTDETWHEKSRSLKGQPSPDRGRSLSLDPPLVSYIFGQTVAQLMRTGVI